MQITGAQFTSAAALAGNDLATFPDFPAEIRAPAGTPYGVSGFQINFASEDVYTPGDAPDVLVAMNPAALKTNLRDVRRGALLIVNTGAFTPQNLKKAGYEQNPLEDRSLDGFTVLPIDISKLSQTAVKPANLGVKEAGRCKNFWTLGLMFWLYGRPCEPTLDWISKKFKGRPELALANTLALKAGHAYGETVEAAHFSYEVPAADVAPGTYRNIGGNTAISWGLLAAAELSGLELVLGAYPITPASDVLHELSKHKHFGVTTIQAEDEIAAVCAAIGASYAGRIGVTVTSGPGMALKTEAIGLAVATELPLVILNIQRGGPSTGLPTKTEQADLFQAVYGRNGEAPVCVLAASSPGNCFHMALEAARIALKYMTPVILLSDGYVANGAEPWKIPDVDALPKIEVEFRKDPEGFHPFLRDPETLARNWAIPGTPGLVHRIGGLEKDFNSGHISYDGQNHEKMSRTRAEKIDRIADSLPPFKVERGPDSGKLLVLGWGSTYGAIHEAVRRAERSGLSVAHAHLHHINPLPKDLPDVLRRFERVLIPELNLGQLAHHLRAHTLIPVESLTKMEGKPFKVDEIESAIRRYLEA
jgi:2-oxoglutarate ferredoxin oxidoreductase subunit alpha